ncbi:M56 family metallopeptidase [Leeuwenhoekiella sp. MAR_2009_132]|uniref:M56 family metallopeptidase n=1 Tax=Leeuwenhoekiella sp. MAR_2009_132 TaxID=1392489 RepID=UPI00048E323E|nr:M56 family metallopeptidase [Leeuwenhoekiella sp. MAR_2009_132]
MLLITYLLKSAAILAIFYVAYKLLLEKETFFKLNRHFLFIGILTAIFAPAITLSRTVYKKEPLINFDIPVQNSVSHDVTTAAWLDINGWQIAGLIYGVGVLIMIFLLFKKIINILIFIKKTASTTRNGFHYIQIDGLETPFSFFNYIVLDHTGHNQAELDMIILHEQTHARQRHSLDMLLMQVTLVMLWFNPFAWLYKKAVDQNLEYLADFATASQVADQKQYQMALVRVALPQRVPSLTHSFYQSFIKKRIVMLNKQESKRINKWKMLLVLPVMAAFMWSFNVKEVVSYTSESEAENATVSGEQAAQSASLATSQKETGETSEMKTNPVIELTPKTESPMTNLKEFKKVISKSATKAELDALVKELKSEYKVSLKYSKLKYNSQGLITSITLNVVDEESGSKSSSSYNSSNPIGDIVIYRSEDGSFGVVSASNSITQRSGTNTIVSGSDAMREQMDARRAQMDERRAEMEKRREEMDKRREEMDARRLELDQQREEMEKQSKSINQKIDEEEKPIKIELREKHSNAKYVKDQNAENESSKALIVIDGKVVENKNLNSIDPATIESINVLKGEEQTKQYKDQMKGKTGVIIIKLKKGSN